MKIRTLAFSTLGSFLRNKVIILFCSIFLCVVLFLMSPLMAFKAKTTTANAQQMHEYVVNEITAIMSAASAFGSLLAAWAAADSVAGEIKSGTILAVMARPLRRWEFLAGKYLGVLMLMAVYVFAMAGVTFFLAWLGGQSLETSLWTLLVYPLVRYAVWAAMAMFLVTLVHPVFVMGLILVLAMVAETFSSSRSSVPAWLRVPVHVVLPMTNLLSEDRFLAITQASLKPFAWTSHVIVLAYGLNYALVCFLLAAFVFQHRSLVRD